MIKLKVGIAGFVIGTVALFAACSVDWNSKTEFINSGGAGLGLYTSIGTNYLGQVKVVAGYTSTTPRNLYCTLSEKSCYGVWSLTSSYTKTNVTSWAVDSGWVDAVDTESNGIKATCRIVNAQQASTTYEYSH